MISTHKARATLLIVWGVFALFHLGAFIYLYVDSWIEQDNLTAGLRQVNSVYVTYLGAMLAFIFTDAGNAALKKKQAATPFIIALVGSLGWNLVISIFVFRLLLQAGEVEDSIKQIGDIAPLLSWLVAPAIGYYFAKSSK
jgi:hypothetical protein